MNLNSVAVLGGGPGGLYAARLIKLHHPDCQVEVYEQDEPGQTFGFGVGLASRTQRNLQAADPESFDDIVRRSWTHDGGMAVGERQVRLPGDNLLSIGRSTLLEILRTHARTAGVVIHSGQRRDVNQLTADLVIAADGAGSATRELWATDFGASVAVHEGLYLWCGTDFALPRAVFRPVETEFGHFVAHAYPYQADRSTFLIETDEDTWRRAGFDISTENTPRGESDVHSLHYLSKAFDIELHGRELIGNRTRWLRFRTVRCERWHRENVVLLGDAVHTAHYSIGSGTKLAMEDAIVLDRMLAEAPDLTSALTGYEQERRSAVDHLQATARRSMLWWDSFPQRLDLSIEQLLVSYMTRAGKVPIDRFSALAPAIVDQSMADYAGTEPPPAAAADRVEWILSRPLNRPGRSWSTRVVDPSDVPTPTMVTVPEAWGRDADALVDSIASSHPGPAELVALTSPADLGGVLTMFDIGERVRRRTGAVVVAEVPQEMRVHAAGALVSGRTDLVAMRP